MKAVIQRVTSANVMVNHTIIGEIFQGILVYLGLGHNDDLTIGKKMIDKILAYRIFENAHHKMDKNIADVGGGLLLVPQFTLLANTNNGRRPDFGAAMHPDFAKPLFGEMVNYAKQQYHTVATGEFGANMQVTSCNDGPINFIFELN
ncbi:D-tyrosyl-tRNA(Tyr) deacylase [Moraxella macacae 0408225]|uniref:D-aminoacyl-tRNA deacylase n=1 Tax=Moraxella macacae 0408225 TaxID=1230338 RepID=L2F9C9_9GAMM|nr:D-aminoacyl-tRNA deacylase [Moraxella macacae]ELA09669.1 D-tyrosyl-tRNA(Tyr) deacylase [Moraxella macacae 0408225]